MPTYQYACTECGHDFEQVQAFSDASLTVCPACDGRLRKVFNAVGVVFKGSGFYRNDSRETSNGSGTANGKDSSSQDSGSQESGSKDSGSKESASKESASSGDKSSKDSSSSTSGSSGAKETSGSTSTSGSGSSKRSSGDSPSKTSSS